MKLSTGKVAFPIEFDNGDTEVIYFNPNDVELANRMKNLQAELVEKAKEIEKQENEGDYLAMFSALNESIKQALNKAFNSDVSTAVFKYCSPFAIIDGEFYVSLFLSQAVKAIQKECSKSQKKLEKHIGKYKKQ